MTDTSQEILDIVDKNDNPLGTTKFRYQVHKELTDWHRVSVIYIINDQMQLLCQKRALTKDVNPGMWQACFGGHLQSGQTYDNCATQELNEELGLHVHISDLVYLGKSVDYKHKHHIGVYAYRWNGDLSMVQFNDGEVDNVQWRNLDEYARLKTKNAQTKYKYDEHLIKYINNTFPINSNINQTQAAGGIIFNSQGKIAVVSQHGTSWSLPKGGVEEGEEIIESATREIHEETGVSELELIRPLGSFTRSGISRYGSLYSKKIHIFLFKTSQTNTKPIDPDNPEVVWLDKDKVAEKLTYKEDKAFFTSVINSLL